MKRILSLFLAAALLGTTASSHAKAFRWRNVVMGGGGFVSAIIANPSKKNLFYARTDVGGAYRWSEKKQGWIPITDWLPPEMLGVMGVDSIASDPNSPGKVYLVGGTTYWNGGRTYILRSADYGNNWESTEVTDLFKANGNSMGRQNGERLAVDPNLGSILLCGTRRNGLFRSTDSGVSWSRVESFETTTTPNGNGISFVAFDPQGGRAGQPTQRIYAGLSQPENNILFSSDGGKTWSVVTGGPTGVNPQRFALGTDGMLYITFANGAGPHGDKRVNEPMSKGAIWKLDTRSGKWSDITPMERPNSYSGISVSQQDPRRLVATTINCYSRQPGGWGDRIYLSENGGRTWESLLDKKNVKTDNKGFGWLTRAAIHWASVIVIDPFNKNRAFVTSGQGIFVTEDLGAASPTWAFGGKGIEETVPMSLVSIPNGPMISSVLDYDGFRHDDVTQPPERKHTPGMGSGGQIAMAGLPPHLLARVAGKVQFSEDQGKNWIPVDGAPEEKASRGNIALSADGKVFLWNPNGSKVLYRTVDRGKTWETVRGIDFAGMPVGDPVNPRKFYLFQPSTGVLWASTDGGASFAKAGEPGKGGSNQIRIVPGREGMIWLPHGGNGLAYSTDSGRTFQKIDTVTSANAVGIGKPAPGRRDPTVFIYGRVGESENGVFGSTNLGKTWVRMDDERHRYGGMGNGQFVHGDANVFGRVYMSTAGRGLVYAEPTGQAPDPAAIFR